MVFSNFGRRPAEVVRANSWLLMRTTISSAYGIADLVGGDEARAEGRVAGPDVVHAGEASDVAAGLDSGDVHALLADDGGEFQFRLDLVAETDLLVRAEARGIAEAGRAGGPGRAV